MCILFKGKHRNKAKASNQIRGHLCLDINCYLLENDCQNGYVKQNLKKSVSVSSEAKRSF